MASGLDSLGPGKKAFMVIRFTGKITKKKADEFNSSLDKALEVLGKTSAGGRCGQVLANNAGRVTVSHGGRRP